MDSRWSISAFVVIPILSIEYIVVIGMGYMRTVWVSLSGNDHLHTGHVSRPASHRRMHLWQKAWLQGSLSRPPISAVAGVPSASEPPKQMWQVSADADSDEPPGQSYAGQMARGGISGAKGKAARSLGA